MARKKEELPNIPVSLATEIIEARFRAEFMWRTRAVTLLQMVGQEGVDQQKLAAMIATLLADEPN